MVAPSRFPHVGVGKRRQPPDFGELEPDETLVTINEFLSRGNDTLLVFTHERFANVESRDRHLEGWTRILDGFQKHF